MIPKRSLTKTAAFEGFNVAPNSSLKRLWGNCLVGRNYGELLENFGKWILRLEICEVMIMYVGLA
jgi:hypothetical protein